MGTEAQYIINLFSPYILAYGYWVAFFGMMLENAGIPVPAETALIVCSLFASQGTLKIGLIIPIAILGDVIGDNIGFFIGRLGGRPLIQKYGRYIRLDKDKLEAMESLFKEKGGRTVFTAHFFATTRISAALIAGISHMHYPRFLAFNVAAAVSFITLVAGATFAFGKSLDATLRFFHLFRLAGLTIAILLVATYLHRFYQRKKHLHNKLGLKIISISIATSLLLGLIVYGISGVLIILPRTNKNAGSIQGSIQGADFIIEQGFISELSKDSLLVTALGQPRIMFNKSERAPLIKVTVRNIKAAETVVRSNGLIQQPMVLDPLTINFGITLNAAHTTAVRLNPKVVTDHFYFTITGDTHESGTGLKQLFDSINDADPAFLIHAGDLVIRGKKRWYKAILDQIDTLQVPFYSAIGVQELTSKGEPIFLQLFGPKNYSLTYQNSFFIFFDTSKITVNESDLEWLEKELKKGEEYQNVFLVTYAAPLGNQRFTELMNTFNVKNVFSVIVNGPYPTTVTGVKYDILEQKKEDVLVYKIVYVNGNSVSEKIITVIPKKLTMIEKIGSIFHF
jgi:membrane protein DedA with SNARE-associated domain